MGSAPEWTALEQAMVDGFVRAGMVAVDCLHVFPDRTHYAVTAKFRDRRKVLGIPTAFNGRRGKIIADSAIKPGDVVVEISPPPVAPTIAPLKKAELFVPVVKTAEQTGCDTMLRRMIETGQHWITDPARFASACRSVGLKAEIAA